jgi:FeS assembly SUF system protein
MYKNDNPSPLEKQIISTLKFIFDPEIPVNVFDLGLIYEINVSENKDVQIVMTLTSPNCPVAESLPQQIKEEVERISEVNSVKIELSFDPPWDSDNISDEAKLDLGLL